MSKLPAILPAATTVLLLAAGGGCATKDDVAAAGICDIRVAVRADDNLLGGMTYRLDPELTRPHNVRLGA